ncbi:unnamed protein product [Dovyalis caffra]|uniref:Uncharacterized protein n=1 Tax=Dovyalis caffra TaxID=77055 RepID=A0AAV1RR53_9ROSI|nr:unnamed protein product [Dovyalis caffra]
MYLKRPLGKEETSNLIERNVLSYIMVLELPLVKMVYRISKAFLLWRRSMALGKQLSTSYVKASFSITNQVFEDCPKKLIEQSCSLKAYWSASKSIPKEVKKIKEEEITLTKLVKKGGKYKDATLKRTNLLAIVLITHAIEEHTHEGVVKLNHGEVREEPRIFSPLTKVVGGD